MTLPGAQFEIVPRSRRPRLLDEAAVLSFWKASPLGDGIRTRVPALKGATEAECTRLS
jgi:hypothetical protein